MRQRHGLLARRCNDLSVETSDHRFVSHFDRNPFPLSPELTWRDVQHVVVWTADPLSLDRDAGWRTNGAGIPYSSRFGFGLLGAMPMVQAARRWVPVPVGAACERAMSAGYGSSLCLLSAVIQIGVILYNMQRSRNNIGSILIMKTPI